MFANSLLWMCWTYVYKSVQGNRISTYSVWWRLTPLCFYLTAFLFVEWKDSLIQKLSAQLYCACLFKTHSCPCLASKIMWRGRAHMASSPFPGNESGVHPAAHHTLLILQQSVRVHYTYTVSMLMSPSKSKVCSSFRKRGHSHTHNGTRSLSWSKHTHISLPEYAPIPAWVSLAQGFQKMHAFYLA